MHDRSIIRERLAAVNRPAFERQTRLFAGRQILLLDLGDQTDRCKPLNPGNSGGPLLNSRCQIVGGNTAIVALAQGLGFAIGAATARWVVGEVRAHGRVRRRLLGVTAGSSPLPRRLVRELDLLIDQAVEVSAVMPGSPADRAGIKGGDYIGAVQGRLVSSLDDLHRLLTSFPVDAPLEISCGTERGGKGPSRLNQRPKYRGGLADSPGAL